MDIRKVAVIGAGVMGAGIAARFTTYGRVTPLHQRAATARHPAPAA